MKHINKGIYIDKDSIIVDEHLKFILRENGYRIIEHVIKNKQEVIKIELETKIPEKLRKALSGVVQAMATAVEMRDPYTAGHQSKVADIARNIGEEMGIKNRDGMLEGIRIAAAVHDIGKLGLPSDILSKPTDLSDTEFDLIKIHPLKGYKILKEIDFPWPVAEIVYQHHERMDGSGYPRGLKGDEILIETRILAVADVLEAMSSHRPYRPSLGFKKAIKEIRKNKGKLYDSDVVDACISLIEKKKLKEFKKSKI